MLTKSQARAFFLGGTLLFSVIFLALTFDTHRKVPAQTNDDQITEDVIAGKAIWEENNCMGCHTLFGEGAYYAPELTKTVERRGEPWLRVFLKDPQKMYPGRRKMVQYDFTEEELDQIIAFLDWCGKVDLNGFPADPPLRAKIETTKAAAVTPVELLPSPPPSIMVTAACTGCHSVAGEGGAAGAAIGAPALDGVYLKKSREELREWIEDPQGVKPGTAMPDLVPSVVSEEQLDEIVDYLYSNAPAS
ncbi:MAG: c-type cytochrome [Chthoniobacterales bacterium]